MLGAHEATRKVTCFQAIYLTACCLVERMMRTLEIAACSPLHLLCPECFLQLRCEHAGSAMQVGPATQMLMLSTSESQS